MLNEYLSQISKSPAPVVNNVSAFINQRIQQIDELIGAELNELMHHSDFQKLEGSWRGLNYLVMNTETSTHLKLRLLNITKKSFCRIWKKSY